MSTTLRDIPLSDPIQSGLYDVCVCVNERHPKNEGGKKRENEGERMRQGERGREWGKKTERECTRKSTYHRY